MRILVTGAASGLGRALHERLQCEAFIRGDRLPPPLPYDVIMHCAASSAKAVPLDRVGDYLRDNLLLTETLLMTPHAKFIYLSSVDIYPRDMAVRRADANPDVAGAQGLYAASKLFSEALVRERGRRSLILRPATLLGPHMRPNSLRRMLTEPDCRLFLSPRSELNLVLHRDVCDFVELAIARDLSGTYNLASSDTVMLGTVAARLGLAPEFGEHLYNVGYIDQRPAAEVCPAFARPSWETLRHFIGMLGHRYIGREEIPG